MTTRSAVVLLSIILCAVVEGTAGGDPLGKDYYRADCALCHGLNGNGDVPGMSAVPGYISVDLTQITKQHNGVFPRQEVYDAIDGRKRFPAHFIGDMPTWGLKYDQTKLGPSSEKEVKRKISALVDYIESLQEK
jgi:Cytochrome c